MTSPQTHAGPVPRPAAARGRGEETATRILDAAEDCFARKGYDGTTLRDVAEIVGIRIPSLYNHFESKQALYGAVLERGITPIRDLLARAVESDDEGYADPAATIRDVMALLRERPSLPRLIQYEMLAGGEQLAMIVEGWLRPTLEQSLEMLQATPAVHRWKPEHLPYLLVAFVNLVLGHFTLGPLIDQLLGDTPGSPESVDRATDFYGQVAAVLTLAAPPAPNTPASASETQADARRPVHPHDPNEEQAP